MTKSALHIVESLFVIGIAAAILSRPQWFTKKDLRAAENTRVASQLRLAGWMAVAGGVLLLVDFIASVMAKK